jgi:transcriptional regulator with XRE-family HTH domain
MKIQSLELNKAAVNLRKIIGCSQARFAAMLGLSKSAVISIENRQRGVTKATLEKISTLTGAKLRPGGKVLNKEGRAYAKPDFEAWSQILGDPQEFSQTRFKEVCGWLAIMFKAASRTGLHGEKNRGPILWLALTDWMESARRDFNLGPGIDRILKEGAAPDTKTFPVGVLRKNPAWAKFYRFQDSKKLKDTDTVTLTVRPVQAWAPRGAAPKV